MYLEEALSEGPAPLPEHALWLAVIERAIIDYINPSKDCPHNSKFGLSWFLFERKPEPNNLTYICENLIEYPDAPKIIRRKVKTLFNNKKLRGTMRSSQDRFR